MIQKVVQVGNSLMATIPSDFAKEVNIKAGQKIKVEVDREAQMVTIQKTSGSVKSGDLTPEFLGWLKKFNAKYKDVLSELAKK